MIVRACVVRFIVVVTHVVLILGGSVSPPPIAKWRGWITTLPHPHVPPPVTLTSNTQGLCQQIEKGGGGGGSLLSESGPWLRFVCDGPKFCCKALMNHHHILSTFIHSTLYNLCISMWQSVINAIIYNPCISEWQIYYWSKALSSNFLEWNWAKLSTASSISITIS